MVSEDGQVAKKQKTDHDVTENSHALFSWMGWAPKVGSPCYQALHKHFPGAIPGTALFHRTKLILTDAEYGMTPENTLYGHSICPDEINNEKGDLGEMMKDFWGECFPFGGIGGAPFVGKTGFAAFSQHVPENGHILILFGPHMAISMTGELGKYLREGQSKESTACGAILAGYKQCCGSKSGTVYDDPDDMQQSWIRSKLEPHIERIQKAEEPMAELANAAYEMVAHKMKRVVNTDFGPGNIVLIGGIFLNMPKPCEDHFVPKFFEIRSKGHGIKNVMDTLKMSLEVAG